MATAIHVTDADLVQAIDGELPAHHRHAVEAHVHLCRSCASRQAMLSATISVVAARDRTDGNGDGADMAFARTRLAAAMRESAAEPFTSRWLSAVRPVRRAATAAAVALLTVGAVLSIRSMPPAPLAATASAALMPNAGLTPGAVAPLTAAELCEGARPSRVVSLQAQREVLMAYGMERAAPGAFELDALVTPELGGTTTAANLWPQRYDAPVWNALVKDQLERLLPELVCSRQVELSVAQRDLATDWIAAYKKYFRTDAPIVSRSQRVATDDKELELELATLRDVHVPTMRLRLTGVFPGRRSVS